MTPSAYRLRRKGPRAGIIACESDADANGVRVTKLTLQTAQLDGIDDRMKVMKRVTCEYRDSSYFARQTEAAFSGNS